MNDDTRLSLSDHDFINKILATELLRDSRANRGFLHLLHLWDRFTTSIENGYPDIHAEYAYALGIRDLIEELILRLPTDIAGKVRILLEPIDSRFRHATRDVAQAVFPAWTRTDPQAFWWFRIPRQFKFSRELATFAREDWAIKCPELADLFTPARNP